MEATGCRCCVCRASASTSQASWDVVSPNMFAGSILDLEPDTAYEARFVMSDPDGIAGQSVEDRDQNRDCRVRVRNRSRIAGGRVYHVYPSTYKGTKIEPAFDGVMCAYKTYCGGGDTTTTARPRVGPGDTILVHAGLYRTTPNTTARIARSIRPSPYEGTYYLTASGTADKPIVIKGAGDGEVIFDGNGNFNLFNVKAGNYNYIEGVTIRNTDIAIWAGTQFIGGSKGPHGQELPIRKRGPRRVLELFRIERLPHRRQLCSSAATIPITSSAGAGTTGLAIRNDIAYCCYAR